MMAQQSETGKPVEPGHDDVTPDAVDGADNVDTDLDDDFTENDDGFDDELRDGGLLPIARPPRPRLACPLLKYDEIPGDLTEALRGIINRYELRSGEALPATVAVTSSVPGEGVTTVSQAFATMIAQEMGRFVCWVDCGWLAASAGTAADDGRPDLLEILADNSMIHAAFQVSPELPRLMSLAPGPVPEGKRNLIVRSPAFEQLLAVLAQEFDHVVFDVPPVLSNANGLALLRQADASLFVVQHRSTTLSQVQRAISATQPTPNVGVVLNHYRTSIPLRLRRQLGG